ncbi:glycosyl hydrolase family 28 protein [Martelella sp. HB161492]|uniref:polygalacturonase PglB n=1 Tax=Martelella sp. HB161492 TaxID=2720726 RepID=UPI0015912603|nr:glycosyl hydrolase family 28 protein [Martelella sp. HB161492]
MAQPREIRIASSASPATQRIQNAIDSAVDGPVRIVLEPGPHHCDGLQLRSGVTLHLKAAAELIFADSYDAYAGNTVDIIAEESDRAMLVAAGARDIAITGEGRILCNSGAFASDDDPEMGTLVPAMHRPRLLVLDSCSAITITDITIVHSPMWTLHFVDCSAVVIRGVTIDNDCRMPNTDGIVIDGCHDVTISDCDIATADDGVVLKTTRRRDGSLAASCERIHVHHCRVSSQSCALKIGTESFSPFRNIVFEHCEIVGSNRGLGIFSRDGGTVERIRFCEIRLDCRETPDGFWGSGEALTINVISRRPQERRAGWVRDVEVSNISGTMEGAINICAEQSGDITGVNLKNIALQQRQGFHGTARSYDLRPTPADLGGAPEGGGRMNAWRKGSDGRVIGLIDYPGGMPGIFSANVGDLALAEIVISRPDPLPDGFNQQAVVAVGPA